MLWALGWCPFSRLTGGGLPSQRRQLPLARGDDEVTAQWVSWPPSPVAEKRGNTRQWGIPLGRHAPRPLPLDTLVFFVTCFSFCFSSLVPFFRGHFHFRLSVSPHPTPTRPLGSAGCPPPLLPWDPHSTVASPRRLSDVRRREAGMAHPPGSLLGLSGQ